MLLTGLFAIDPQVSISIATFFACIVYFSSLLYYHLWNVITCKLYLQAINLIFSYRVRAPAMNIGILKSGLSDFK